MQPCWVVKTEFVITHLLWKVTLYKKIKTDSMGALMLFGIALCCCVCAASLWGWRRQRLICIPCYRGFLNLPNTSEVWSQTGSNTLLGYGLKYVIYRYYQLPEYIIKSINTAAWLLDNSYKTMCWKLHLDKVKNELFVYFLRLSIIFNHYLNFYPCVGYLAHGLMYHNAAQHSPMDQRES